MEGRQAALGHDRTFFQPPLQRPRPRHAARSRELLRLQGHVPRQEEGGDRRCGVPVRAQGHVRGHDRPSSARRTTRAGRWTASSSTRSAVGTVTASAAYEKVDLDDAYSGASPTRAPSGLFGEKNGWYAKGGYLLPGTPLQVFGRYEKWRFAQLANVYDQTIDWYGFGANYYVWGQNLKLTAEWSKTDFDQEGTFSTLQSTRRTKDFNRSSPSCSSSSDRHLSGGAAAHSAPPAVLCIDCGRPAAAARAWRSTHDEAHTGGRGRPDVRGDARSRRAGHRQGQRRSKARRCRSPSRRAGHLDEEGRPGQVEGAAWAGSSR